MERIKRSVCPVCENKKVSYAFSQKYSDMFLGLGGVHDYELDVMYCEECGMIWSGNPIDVKLLDRYYKHMSKYESEEFDDEDFSKQKMFDRQFSFINSSTEDYESVLEIGAATGENLAKYKNQGKKVLGIEPSETNKKRAKQKYGVELFAGTFNEWFEETQESFDLIFSSHSLEHIVDFNELIAKAKTRNNKYFFVEVPATNMMGDYVEPWGTFTAEHVNYFTDYSLNYLMTLNGYERVKINNEMNLNGANPGYPSLVSLWQIGGAGFQK